MGRKVLQSGGWRRCLFQREPLCLDPAILLHVGAERFLPASADRIEPFHIDLLAFNEQAFDFVRAVFAELDGFQRFLLDERITALLLELRGSYPGRSR